jgi:putative CocE/NonD family hydrolase
MRFEGAAGESGRAAKAFFDRWLRGVDAEAWDAVPRVRWWQVGEDGWRACDDWTKARRVRAVLRLGGDGKMGGLRARIDGDDRSWTLDPHRPPPTLGGANLPPVPHGPTRHESLDARADVLAYKTRALTRPMVLQGSARLTLTLCADRPDCDVVARLCVRAPDGATYLLAERAQRMRYRDGDDDPVPPGRDATVRLVFPPVAATIAKGHMLVLYVSGASSPRYARNPHTGADAWDARSARDVTVTIHHDDARTATLALPRLQ